MPAPVLLEFGTRPMFERTEAGSSSPWLPTIACLLAAVVTAAVTCPEPLSGTPTPAEAALRALLAVCLVGGVTAAVARVSFAAFSPCSSDELQDTVLAFAGTAVWLAPLAVFVVQKESWSFLGAAAVGIASANLLWRCRAGSDPEAAADPASGRVPFLAEAGSSQTLLFSFAGAAAVQAGICAHAIGQVAAAALLTGAGCLIAGGAAPVVKARTEVRRPRAGLAIRSMCAVVLAALGLTRLPGPSHASGERNASANAASALAGVPDKNLLAGAILLADPPKDRKLIAPVVNRSGNVSLKRAIPPDSIDFSGEYWIFPISLRRPPKGSMVERASPLGFKFTCVDRSPLIMLARQRLRAALDPRCCSAIEVAVRSADPQPETITVRTSLATSTLTRGRYQQLGARELPAAESAVLRFPMPARSTIPEFDEIVVEFELSSPRLHRSANVSVQRFVFIPRAR